MFSLRLGMMVTGVLLAAGPLAAQQAATPQNDTTTSQAPAGQATRPTGPAAPNVQPSRRDEPGSSSATEATPPIAGANSFTESQARDRIAKSGFNDVTNLKQDAQGVWRGEAQKGGTKVGVALDYRGNVVQQ